MKVAVMSSHTPSLFWFRMDMMSYFRSMGHDVIAIGDQSEDVWCDRFLKKGIRYRKAFIQRNGVNPVQDVRTLVSLRNILREERPDKIFVYQAKTVIYGTIAANCEGITEVYPLIAGVGSVFLSDSMKSQIIKLILCAEYRFSLRKCPYLFFQNQDDVKLFADSKIIKNQKIEILRGSGVNLEKFQVQKLPQHFGVLCIARLIKDKGVIEYLEACKEIKKRHPEIRCLLVGPFDTNPSAIQPDELGSYLEAGVIEYFGEQSDVRPFFAESSVFILPSYREGTPKTVLEAMASGRAVITTNAPGCRETVVNGHNGFLVPVKDIKSIVEAVEQLYADPTLLKRMGESGRQMAEEFFDVKKVNQTIAETMRLDK